MAVSLYVSAGKRAFGNLWKSSLSVLASNTRLPPGGIDVEKNPAKPLAYLQIGSINPLSCRLSTVVNTTSYYNAGTGSIIFSSHLSSTSVAQSKDSHHFKRSAPQHPLTGKIETLQKPVEEENDGYTLPHPIWSKEEVESVQITHTPPVTMMDKFAYYAVQLLRLNFDLFSGYLWGKRFGTLDEKKWLSRIIFLETIAGVPGIIGAMSRHLKSLRLMQRDYGWIHTLLEEAENERMHLLTALELRCPGPVFRAAVIVAQGIFTTLFWIVYPFSAKFCHRFVGYLEEEAVKTYTLCLQCLDEGKLPMWAKMPAPEIAANYWRLGEGAMMRDVILAIRADEAHHRVVNHTLSSMQNDDLNPHKPGE